MGLNTFAQCCLKQKRKEKNSFFNKLASGLCLSPYSSVDVDDLGFAAVKYLWRFKWKCDNPFGFAHGITFRFTCLFMCVRARARVQLSCKLHVPLRTVMHNLGSYPSSKHHGMAQRTGNYPISRWGHPSQMTLETRCLPPPTTTVFISPLTITLVIGSHAHPLRMFYV